MLGDAFPTVIATKNSSAFHALKVFPVPVSPFRTITFMNLWEFMNNEDERTITIVHSDYADEFFL